MLIKRIADFVVKILSRQHKQPHYSGRNQHERRIPDAHYQQGGDGNFTGANKAADSITQSKLPEITGDVIEPENPDKSNRECYGQLYQYYEIFHWGIFLFGGGAALAAVGGLQMFAVGR